jgi:hypothetical protein
MAPNPYVTGYYRVAGRVDRGDMPAIGFGSYAGTSQIPGQPPRAMIPTTPGPVCRERRPPPPPISSAYSSNLHVTATITNFVSRSPRKSDQ